MLLGGKSLADKQEKTQYKSVRYLIKKKLELRLKKIEEEDTSAMVDIPGWSVGVSKPVIK